METSPERLPPHSIEAENSVLGAMLTDPATCVDSVIESGITKEWFYDLRNQEVFGVILKMHSDKCPIDSVTIVERLMRLNMIESVGGIIRITDELPRFCHSTANLPYWVDIIRAKFRARTAIRLMEAATEEIMSGCDSVEDTIIRAEGKLFDLMSNNAATGVQSLKVLGQEAIDSMERRISGQFGLKTGYPDLDAATCGMQDGEMWVVAGRPSTGKTSLAMGIVENVVRSFRREGLNHAAVVFSLEMSGPGLFERMVSSKSLVDIRRVMHADEAERSRLFDATSDVANLDRHLIIDATPGLTISKVAARARRYAKRGFVKLVMIDYLQLINSDMAGRNQSNRREAVDEISRGIKNLARELNVPVIALAQLNREFEKEKGRIPRMSDLRESGQIEQDADLIGMLYEKGAEDSTVYSGPKEVFLRVVKQRNGPKDIDIPFVFRPQFTRFDSVAKISEKDIPR